jgi:hypothetical protein
MLPCAAPQTAARPAISRFKQVPAAASDVIRDALSQPWHVRAATLARRNWLLAAFLAAGLIARLLTGGPDPIAFGPAMLGMAVAVALYAVSRRRGVTRWLAAVAAVPVLLGVCQLPVEQTIMPDVWFDALIVAGLAVLLWRPGVPPLFAAGAGLVLGSSATVRTPGEVLIVPAAGYLLAVWGGWRPALRRLAVFAVVFALPILGYCGVSYLHGGHFARDAVRLFAVTAPPAAGGWDAPPGPLLLAFALAGMTGSLLALLRRARGARSRGLALGCLLFTATAVTFLLVPDVLGFSWRSQLPVLVTLPPAAVLGISAAANCLRTRRDCRTERLVAASDVTWIPGPPRPAGP